MGKVIHFPQHKRQVSELMKLKQFSDSIDQLVVEALQDKGMEPYELAGILAHRLGTLIRPMAAKDELWGVCEKVLKKQAIID